ncbi:MAG: hypothetical protein QMD04_14945, partial [Anaerolineales bacterium]|nr:hypothetical protein [Anaerolineales bacterium]
FFLTHPRNAGRQDLGCPYGCKQAHRKESAKKRSIEYYQTPQGKFKKSLLNNARSKPKDQSIHPEEDSSGEDSSDENSDCQVGEITLDQETVDYLQSVTSLIEGRHVTQEEILSMLAKKMRQLNIAKKKKIEYTLEYLIGKAP